VAPLLWLCSSASDGVTGQRFIGASWDRTLAPAEAAQKAGAPMCWQQLGRKAALPGGSFAVGSLISIAVRGVMTVGELIYVGGVTLLGRRMGWTIHTGILHPSPEEQEAGTEETAIHTPEIL